MVSGIRGCPPSSGLDLHRGTTIGEVDRVGKCLGKWEVPEGNTWKIPGSDLWRTIKELVAGVGRHALVDHKFLCHALR